MDKIYEILEEAKEKMMNVHGVLPKLVAERIMNEAIEEIKRLEND